MNKPDASDAHDKHPVKDQDQDQDQSESEKKKSDEHEEALLDETIDESFPASDPPGTY